jgi:hypothetical protein
MGAVPGEHLAGLGEPAASAVALDETLTGGSFENAEVLARCRLTDPDCARGGRDAPLAADLDEEAEARAVPDERECAIGQGDTSYRNIRLVPSYRSSIR